MSVKTIEHEGETHYFAKDVAEALNRKGTTPTYDLWRVWLGSEALVKVTISTGGANLSAKAWVISADNVGRLMKHYRRPGNHVGLFAGKG